MLKITGFERKRKNRTRSQISRGERKTKGNCPKQKKRKSKELLMKRREERKEKKNFYFFRYAFEYVTFYGRVFLAFGIHFGTCVFSG
ncbi:hypothetical protein CEXT_90291 [Caerostris extrusa]|uniref:Uncharacterized protein n=1 Tax=Caerostris extrusa TaxID=172846 RepID=A0AAV4NPA6_CAEEX|nr:hypothetical protein CEXT_90291 [Caerostris extrusa]